MGLDLIPLNFPLGCGPGGGCLLLGMSAPEVGLSALEGASAPEGVSALGVSALGGCLLFGGSAPGGYESGWIPKARVKTWYIT